MKSAQPATGISKPKRRKEKLVDEIIESLRQDIVTHRLPHGERLPSEKALSERFEVSQPTVREAIRALETLGLLEVRHGSGTYVRGHGDFALASALQTILQLERVGIMDVLDVRQVLGRHSIEIAAVNATDDDIEAIATSCASFDRLSELKNVDEVINRILHFQRIVSAASHNPLLHSLELFLLAVLNEVQVNSLARRSVRFWCDRAVDFQPHRTAILAGLKSKDPIIARKAMDRYFEAQRARFETGEQLRELNLSNPNMINIMSNLVRQFRT